MSEVLSHLLQSQALDLEIDRSGLRTQINSLRTWQCQRLLKSYDAIYQKKNYQGAVDFFTQELYGPNDFTQRDKDIKKVLPLMEAVLSKKTMSVFEIALKLNTLSYQLDIEIVKHLTSVDKITNETYANAYKACANRNLRELQLEYIELLASHLAGFAAKPSIMMMLKLSRKPAKLAGLAELQNILESGANAFKNIGKISDFIQPILQGEKEVMNALFLGKHCLP